MRIKKKDLLAVGIVGAGYISDFHARALRATKGVRLVAVCDQNEVSAQAFAARWGVESFASIESMFAGRHIDAVHILTPPDSHHALAMTALKAGKNVFIEKPMCPSSEQCNDLTSLAVKHGVEIGISHNMLFVPAYQRLRQAVKGGVIGEIDFVSYNYFMDLAPIRAGPFHAWMLRQTQHPLLEIGPHPLSAIIDLVGTPDVVQASADREHRLPSGVKVFRRWRIHGRKDRIAFDVNIDLSPGFDKKILTVRGQSGIATADMDANIATVDKRSNSGMDFDRYRRSKNISSQAMRQARASLRDYVLERAKLGGRGSPYEVSFAETMASFYGSLIAGENLDTRLRGQNGSAVIKMCEGILSAADISNDTLPPRQTVTPSPDITPTVLVLGGTGFIGSHLVDLLVKKGKSVRVASRGRTGGNLVNGHSIEFVRADMRSPEQLHSLLAGIDEVYHLATSDSKSWAEFVEREIEPTEVLGKACLDANVRRLVYAGTIDSYFAGSSKDTITGTTPLDNAKQRNNYARAKAEAERRLLRLHREKGLNVVIARPGIVIGQGGNPFHWGVGQWTSNSVCQVWGDGQNALPLVLVEDVAEGLHAAMETPEVEGSTFLLVDMPLLTARDYIAAVEKITALPIEAHFVPSWRSYATDMAKWVVKVATRHPDRHRVPSLRDWRSRSQRATFDSSETQRTLKWKPAGSVERIVKDGIEKSLESWLAVKN